MLTLMKQEYYKAFKQNRLYIWLILGFIFPIAIIGIFKSTRSAGSIINLGQSLIYVEMAGIIITALSISQEFGFGTIRPLLSRRFSRGEVFISKLLLNISVYIGLFLSAFIGTVLATAIFAPKYDFSQKLGYIGNSWQGMMISIMDVALQMIFVAALVLMVTNMVKSSGAAIGLGVVMIVATPIISVISLKLIDLAPILKWNPFNIYLGIASLGQVKLSIMAQIMDMSQGAMISAYLIYIVLMYGIAYLIFRKRSV
ncbi:ABC transporter permease [Leuconostoc suionicum]|uniref:ABC transporter permease n=1 Tax=Leuconostoc suionicum TaxID=1511761 RepID=UPI000909D96A|nr:ABC transporter permease subunit [Leuconostoc suionicum]API71205.1 ABC transporter permease [Leuconostoc suionicum]MBE4727475.1 ABC transporter permease subunit [Leuconostoc suionicum]BAX69726.1 multi-copper enzyme maturation ABC transporter permease [Leuconostoc suionicum]